MFALLVALVVTQASQPAFAQKTLFGEQEKFSEADRLRGSVTPQRQWWDLKHYDLSIEVFPETKSLKGSNLITFVANEPGQTMQIDLQQPLTITSVKLGESELKFERSDQEQSNVYWISFEQQVKAAGEAP